MIPNNNVQLHCGWLIDGLGSPVRRDVVVEMEKGVFRRIYSAVGAPLPDSVVDLTDCTVLPGLIDAHVHLTFSGTTDPEKREQQLAEDYAVKEKLIRRHLNDHLMHGVVAVRDGGDQRGDVLRYRATVAAGGEVTIRTPGRAWHAANRYGGMIGRAPQINESLADAIRREKPFGDHLKIIHSGLNSLRIFGKETAPQFAFADLKAAIGQGKQSGRKTMVHANGARPVSEAILAGCDSIEHGFFMGAENVRLMADSGTVWVPTAVTMHAYAAVMPSNCSERDIALRNLDHQLAQMEAARKNGVVIALGTDSGSPGVDHGRAMRGELKLLLSAGFSVAEAVRCATRSGAVLLGLDHAGAIAEGMRADLIAVPGPPEAFPESLAKINMIYRDGKLYDSRGRTPAAREDVSCVSRG